MERHIFMLLLAEHTVKLLINIPGKRIGNIGEKNKITQTMEAVGTAPFQRERKPNQKQDSLKQKRKI